MKVVTFALLSYALFFSAAAVGQTVAGSITGLVQDSSGAAVPEVAVTVTDIDRSVVLRGTSNESGFYSVSPVPAGQVPDRSGKSGFRRFVIENFPVATQQKAG
jgi:hypothetical protein